MRKKNAAAVELGRRGGKKRAQNLTAEELSEQGRKAIQARWDRTKNEQSNAAAETAVRAKKASEAAAKARKAKTTKKRAK